MNASMEIPSEWLAEAGLTDFMPGHCSFRCTKMHELVSLNHIQRVIRTVSLDTNGFHRERMMSILLGIRDNADLPPVPVEAIGIGQGSTYKLRDGTHRFYASLRVGFTHLPCEICEAY
jgi:hypothetical protein